MTSQQGAPSLLLLSIASALSPFGMALVVPAMMDIAERFAADYVELQFVISAYIFGLAVAQPVCGFLCDKFGRRPVLLTGFSVFTLASLLCAVAPTLDLLIFARFLQAVGVSVGTVATRAILRDTREGDRIAEAMSYIAIAMGIAPMLAPMLGGYLSVAISYQSVFLLAAVIGLLELAGLIFLLRETRATNYPPANILQWLSSYRVLFTSRSFLANTAIYGFVQGAFFAFLAIGAPLFEQSLDIGAQAFGLVWGFMALNYVVGAWIGAKTTPRFGHHRVMQTAIIITGVGGLLVVLLNEAFTLSAGSVLAPLALLMAAAGVTTPGAMAGAVKDHPGIAGTAAGLSSAIGLVMNGLFTILAGWIFSGGYTPVALLIVTATSLAVISWMMTPRPLSSSS